MSKNLNFAFRAEAIFADILDEYIQAHESNISMSTALRQIFEEWAVLKGYADADDFHSLRGRKSRDQQENDDTPTIEFLNFFPMQEFTDRVAHASIVQGLSSWALPIRYTLDDIPESAQVRVLVMKPDSDVAKNRSFHTSKPARYTSDNVRRFLELIETRGFARREDFLVQVYDVTPPFRYYRVDDVAYVGWYLQHTRSELMNTPHLRIATADPLFHHLNEEFRFTWRHSEPPKLKGEL